MYEKKKMETYILKLNILTNNLSYFILKLYPNDISIFLKNCLIQGIHTLLLRVLTQRVQQLQLSEQSQAPRPRDGHNQQLPAALLQQHRVRPLWRRTPRRDESPHYRAQGHALRQRLLRVRRLLSRWLPGVAATHQPADNWQPDGSLQPQPVPRRQGLPEHSEHVAWQAWGAVERTDVEFPPGSGVYSVADSGAGALLQRAWLWEVAGNSCGHGVLYWARC